MILFEDPHDSGQENVLSCAFADIIAAPVLIGGKDTATLIDGQSLQTRDELDKLGVLRLMEAAPLEDSYLRLRYRVIS